MNSRFKIYFSLILITISVFRAELAYSQNPLKRLEFEKPWKKYQNTGFKLLNNLIIIPVVINDSDTMNFILDTGITTTMITELSNSDTLLLNYAREVQLQGLGVGDPLKGLHSYGNEIRIKGILGRNQDIYVILDNAFQLSARMGMQIHGILGYSVFSNFIVSINYDSKVISFYKPEGFNYKKKHSKYKSMPLELDDTKPYISINIIEKGGKVIPVKLLIDTGASHAIWLDATSLPELKIPDGSRETYLGTGLNGEVHGYLGRINSLDINSNVLNDVIVSFPDSSSISNVTGVNGRNGTMGSEILKRFNIIIDYPNQLISFKPNSYFKTEFIQNLSGMEIIAPYPGIRIYAVEGVQKGSPADLAGLSKGDLIQSINGVHSDKYELADIYQILQNQPGKKINIVYMRDGEIYTAQFRLEEFI